MFDAITTGAYPTNDGPHQNPRKLGGRHTNNLHLQMQTAGNQGQGKSWTKTEEETPHIEKNKDKNSVKFSSEPE
jgi:general stress protein 26